MANRRAKTYAFYANQDRQQRALLVEKSASAAGQYRFRGAALHNTAVVRLDLNGYSSWVRDRAIGARVAILDNFFSATMPFLAAKGGIFFRDEGDCIVCLFSDYFHTGSPMSVVSFCQEVVGRRYGLTSDDSLSVKASIAWGPVAYFQKAHESGTDDWSAEGEPFVRAARLEQAIESKPQLVFYAADYDNVFSAAPAPTAARGSRYFWTFDRRKLQIAGLGLTAGWTEVLSMEHLPGGREQL